MVASHICNRIPHTALNMEPLYKKLYGKNAYLSHLKIIGARAFVPIKSPNKLGHTSWEGMGCGFGQTESNSYRIWNPKTRRVVERRNAVFIETQPNLVPATRRLSPQQDLESPSYDVSDDTLDDSYVSHDDMLRNVQNYTSTLDFGVDTPTGTVELLLTQQASPGVTLPGGAFLTESLPGGVTPEGSSPPPAPASVPRLHQDQRLHLLLRHQGQQTDTPIAVPWESRPPLRAAEPQAFCQCLSLHVTGKATTTEQLWRSFFRRAHYSV